ncbi:MAG: hypothetical protein HY720_15445 [Planctomycetes bacterium]|nr:hypothetical protein [Planctomycetota bacterium]
MKRLYLVLALACLATVPALAEDIKDLVSPLKDAMAGEWATYDATYSNPLGGAAQQISVKLSVVKVDGANVDVQSEMNLVGTPENRVVTIDTSKPFMDSLLNMAGGPAAQMVTNVKITSSSVEDVDYEHNGKTYKAKKVSLELTAEMSMTPGQPGMPVTMTVTSYMSNEVPVNGTIRDDVSIKVSLGGPQPMELTVSQSLKDCGTGAVLDEDEENGGGSKEE